MVRVVLFATGLLLLAVSELVSANSERRQPKEAGDTFNDSNDRNDVTPTPFSQEAARILCGPYARTLVPPSGWLTSKTLCSEQSCDRTVAENIQSVLMYQPKTDQYLLNWNFNLQMWPGNLPVGGEFLLMVDDVCVERLPINAASGDAVFPGALTSYVNTTIMTAHDIKHGLADSDAIARDRVSRFKPFLLMAFDRDGVYVGRTETSSSYTLNLAVDRDKGGSSRDREDVRGPSVLWSLPSEMVVSSDHFQDATTTKASLDHLHWYIRSPPSNYYIVVWVDGALFWSQQNLRDKPWSSVVGTSSVPLSKLPVGRHTVEVKIYNTSTSETDENHDDGDEGAEDEDADRVLMSDWAHPEWRVTIVDASEKHTMDQSSSPPPLPPSPWQFTGLPLRLPSPPSPPPMWLDYRGRCAGNDDLSAPLRIVPTGDTKAAYCNRTDVGSSSACKVTFRLSAAPGSKVCVAVVVNNVVVMDDAVGGVVTLPSDKRDVDVQWAIPIPKATSNGSRLLVELQLHGRITSLRLPAMTLKLNVTVAASLVQPAAGQQRSPYIFRDLPTDGEERFLSYFGVYGRFNNQRSYIYTALMIGKILNRTVILPEFYGQDERMKAFDVRADHYFDLDHINEYTRAIVVTGHSSRSIMGVDDSDRFDNYKVNGNEMDPASMEQYSQVWHSKEDLLQRYGSLPHRLLRFGYLIEAYDFGNLKHSGLSQKWMREDAPLFGVPRSVLQEKLWHARLFNVGFFEHLHTEEYLQVRHAVRFTPIIYDVAYAFMSTYGLNEPFAAVHIRLGSKADLGHQWDPKAGSKVFRVASQQMCPVCCEGSPEFFVNTTVSKMREHGLTKLFLGMEQHNVVHFAPLLEANGIIVRTFVRKFKHNDVLNANAEQIVASRAAIWIGSLCSTMSTAVWEERTLLGHNPDTASWW